MSMLVELSDRLRLIDFGIWWLRVCGLKKCVCKWVYCSLFYKVRACLSLSLMSLHSTIPVFLLMFDSWESISAPISSHTFAPSKLPMVTSNSWLSSFFYPRLCSWCNLGGARGVMVIVVGMGHGDTSSNPGRDRLHFT